MKQVPIEDFEQRYRSDPDPWRFATSEYEQRRFDVTAACLPAGRFRRGFEPGCAGGELTMRLASRCDELVAWDGSETVVEHARRKIAAAGVEHVQLGVGVVPGQWPSGPFDLVVLSEIGYYFDRAGALRLAASTVSCLAPGGTLLAAHWLGHSEDHLTSGDEVHEGLLESVPLAHAGSFRDAGFRIDWWVGR